jgi:primosomal protein N'|tara:strand:+ start:173 stop:331 length:159 start_codon:yes stop_codon:yes gene_type:complete
MSCSYCGAEMKDSEFCPKCGMIKIDYQVLSKLKKFFGRSKDKDDDKDKTKPK